MRAKRFNKGALAISSHSVVHVWNELPEEAVKADTIAKLKQLFRHVWIGKI